jgi:hypothetical protein
MDADQVDNRQVQNLMPPHSNQSVSGEPGVVQLDQAAILSAFDRWRERIISVMYAAYRAHRRSS